MKEKRKTSEPQFARMEPPLNKKRRVATVLKQSLKIDPVSGSTGLHTALKVGNYKKAVAEINKWGLLNAREKDTLWTPLHCLSCAVWDEENFFDLFDMLIKGGCSLNAKCQYGKTFLDNLASCSDLSVDNFKELFRIISQKGYTFYNPNLELPAFLIEEAEAVGIDIKDRAEIVAAYFSYIPSQHKQTAAEQLFLKLSKSYEFRQGELADLIEDLLDRFKDQFDPALVRDADGDNLIHLILLNDGITPVEMVRIIKRLHEAGVDIGHCGNDCTLFEILITTSYTFQRKKEILQLMLDADIECSITSDDEDGKQPLPTPIRLIHRLLAYRLAGKEISEVVQMTLGEDWYREYLLLKLIANCFSQDSILSFEEKEVTLSGCITSFSDFYRWLETESKNFYTEAAHSHVQAEKFLRPISTQLSTRAVKAMERISRGDWCNLLIATGESLGSAFKNRSLKHNTPLKNLLKSRGFFAYTPSLSSGDDGSRHAVGLVFKPPVVLFCNKGADLSNRSGISRHVLSNRKAKIVLKQSLQGQDLYQIIRNHFHTRLNGGKASSFIVTQTSQSAGNCPVASLSSMELGILVSLLEDKLPGISSDIVVEIARGIKKAHRLKRRKKLLEEYEALHAMPGCGLPSFLSSIDGLEQKCPDYFASKLEKKREGAQKQQNGKKRIIHS